MAAPTYVTAIWNQVIITPTILSEAVSNSPAIKTGLVEQVGLSVTRVAVGNYVMYKTGENFSEGTSSWAIVSEDDIYSIVTPAP